MKNTILLSLLFISLWAAQLTTAQDLGNQTPTLKEWTKQNKTQRKYLATQIALLKTYGEVLKKGYAICKNGLTTIGSITDADFNQHQVYFNSLKEVNPAIAKSAQVKQILNWEKLLNKELKTFLSYSEKEPAFTSEEKKYVDQVSTNVLKASNDALDQLDRLITSGKMSMEDDERISRIDSIHRASSNRYSFVRSFKDGARALVAERKKDQKEVEYSLSIHEIF